MEWFMETFGNVPPADYTDFMLSGKNTAYENFCYDFVNEYGNNDSSDIHYWFVMNTDKSYEDMIRRYEQACDNEVIDTDYLPIAEDSGGNLICLSMNDENYGKIYFAVHDSEEPTYCYIANSFTSFLALLYENEL